MESKVLVLGGIGGHSGQAFAISHYLKEAKIEFDVMTLPGTEWRFEGLANEIITLDQLLLPPNRRPNPKALPKMLLKLLKMKRYKVMVANGSNFAVPPALMGKLKGSKLINVESLDAVVEPSKAAKFLSRFSDVDIVQWEELKEFYVNALVSGPIFEPPLYEPRDEGYILVTAGTLGYEELFVEAVKQLSDKYQLLIQTGRVDPERFKGKNVKAFRYSKDFHKLLANAKAVIGVFPATTPATAALAYDKPTVIVPNPNLKSASSLKNMKPFAERIGAVIGDLKNLKESLERAFEVRRPKYENGAKVVVKKVVEMLQ